MPRYFFNFKDGQLLLDNEGTELPDLDAARAQAIIASGTMLHDQGAKFWQDRDWHMWVTDEAGTIVCALRMVAE
jgi:hypothetical protein